MSAVYDPSTYHQAFIGAIAPFTNIMVNPVGAIKYSKMSKEDKAKLSKLEKISSFIFNPILNNLNQEFKAAKDADEEVLLYNNGVTKFGKYF
jgi:hypothetical protein